MEAIQVFLLDEALADVDGTNLLTLAQRAITACGCVMATFLFNGGLISQAAARRLRTASVMYSCSVLASPLIVRMVGGLFGHGLQLLRASLVPFGVASAFVVVNLALNQIYVFDDVQYVPIQLHNQHQQMMFPYLGGHERLWQIQKREHPQALLKKLVQLAQKKFLLSLGAASYQAPILQPQRLQQQQQLIVDPAPPLMDMAQRQFNYYMAAVFFMAASFLCWQNRVRQHAMAPVKAPQPQRTHTNIALRPLPKQKVVAPVAASAPPPSSPSPRRSVIVSQKPVPRLTPLSSMQRVRAAIITSSVLALYMARQPGPDWVTEADFDQ